MSETPEVPIAAILDASYSVDNALGLLFEARALFQNTRETVKSNLVRGNELAATNSKIDSVAAKVDKIAEQQSAH